MVGIPTQRVWGSVSEVSPVPIDDREEARAKTRPCLHQQLVQIPDSSLTAARDGIRGGRKLRKQLGDHPNVEVGVAATLEYHDGCARSVCGEITNELNNKALDVGGPFDLGELVRGLGPVRCGHMEDPKPLSANRIAEACPSE